MSRSYAGSMTVVVVDICVTTLHVAVESSNEEHVRSKQTLTRLAVRSERKKLVGRTVLMVGVVMVAVVVKMSFHRAFGAIRKFSAVDVVVPVYPPFPVQ